MSIPMFTAAQIKANIKLFQAKKLNIMPSGFYGAIRRYPADLKFATHCRFDNGTVFGQRTLIRSNAEIGNNCEFGADSVIEDYSLIGNRAEFVANCKLGYGSRVGHSATFYSGCKIGGACNIGNQGVFHRGVILDYQTVLGANSYLHERVEIHITTSIGANTTVQPGVIMHTYEGSVLKLETCSKNKANMPIMSISGAGSCGRTTYFFNTNKGIYVRSGCFNGTLNQFRAKVKRDCRSPNSVKRLQYLGFANIACVSWGYNNLVE